MDGLIKFENGKYMLLDGATNFFHEILKSIQLPG